MKKIKFRCCTAAVTMIALLITVSSGCSQSKVNSSSKSGSDSSGKNSNVLDGVDIVNRTEKLVTNGYLTWNFENSSDEFTTSKTNSCSNNNGLLDWKPAQTDKLMSPDSLKIPSATVHTIELRILSSIAKKLTVRWKTSGGQFDDENMASIAILVDEKLQDYQIELGQNSKWNTEIEQLSFEAESAAGDVFVDFIRLTGIYFVPFPFLTGKLDTDKSILNDLKATFSEANKSTTIGFSATVEYLSSTNDKGELPIIKMKLMTMESIILIILSV